LAQGTEGGFKHVQANQFMAFMQERLKNQNLETGLATEQVQQQMMPPPPNRAPKFKAPNPPPASYISSTIPQSGFNHDLNSKPDENVGASASDLIQMAADRCLQESAANPLQPNKKVNA
jgi:hypothetical protein|tara:strand:+ start:231 stop:587 length:357 start_codon:yes stop_codon:yes gene_type:complete